MTRIPDTAAQAWSDARAGEKGGDEAERLEALLGRVEAVSGPDRQIDRDIAVALLGQCLHEKKTRSGYQDDTGFTCDACGADSWGNLGKTGQRLYDSAPLYTASIDAALALVERCLPGAEYEITTLYGVAQATLPMNFGDYYEVGRREDEDMPLAILAALLKALIAKGPSP